MKKNLLFILTLCSLTFLTEAQKNNVRPPAIGISFILKDFKTAQNIRSTSLSTVLSDHKWAKFKDMAPGLGISYFQGLTPHIDFAGTLSGAFLEYPIEGKPAPTSDKFLLEADATANFKLLTERYWVQPYAIAGVGGHKYGNTFGAFAPLGVGFKVNFFDETHFFANGTYRLPITKESANYHFNYQIGVAGAIGKKKVVLGPPPPPPVPIDTDADGITDDKDKCPSEKGTLKYEGCPIPDTDADGINDEEDKCPSVKGLAKYAGCPIPDTDKDGVNDEEDKCVTQPGVARYQGCPIPDTDKDGVNDEEDKCPNLAGPAENQGCPVISEDVKKRVDLAAHNILFVTGSAKLQAKSNKGLAEVAKILAENPEMELAIDGHTDNVGNDERNQKLSDDRAATVRKFFADKGVAESRITAAGHGETTPVADNKTSAGRSKNRRVELTLSYFH